MTDSGQTFKAAVVQAAPIFLDRDGTINKGISLIKDAAEKGADLIAFPEVWIPGYPLWIWLGAPAWGMRFVQRYHENSLTLETSQVNLLTEAARENNIHVVMGYSEKAGGSLYMGQMIIDRAGRIVATRRKLKPTHAERTVFGEGDGSHLAVHEIDIGRLGALNCWEHLQPLTKYAMFSMHEQIHVASWPSFSLYRGMAYALGPELNTAASQIYAAEGQCFVLASCAIVSSEMVEMLCDTPDKLEMLKPGGGFSKIFGPDGQPLTEPLPEDVEGIIYADIDLGKISIAKTAADPVGHYSRPDVTRLLLNTTSSRVVENFHIPMYETQPAAAPAEVPRTEEKIAEAAVKEPTEARSKED